MTITLKPWSIGVLIATFAVLVGSAVGQVTASNAGGSASYASTDKAMLKELQKVNKALGNTFMSGTVAANLEAIRLNTGNACIELTGASPLSDTTCSPR